MKLYTTVTTADPRDAGELFARLEEIGYDGAFSYETRHDPFLPLVPAATQTRDLTLGTAIAIAFGRSPLSLAHIGYDLQWTSRGRFVLGLGSQIRPHIENRYGATWSRPAARMHELVRAIRAIWAAWEGVAPLDFHGEFYRHTLMTPAFDPGPNPYGPPRIFTAGVGPRMIEVAGEVADGLIAHPFNTQRSLQQVLVPALERGLARAGRRREECELVCVTLVGTADTSEELAAVRTTMRQQLAFYGSTPQYRGALDCHGWGALQPELNALSKQGRWDDMTELIDDEILETIAVVCPRDQVASRLMERLDGIADSVSIENARHPDPHWWGDAVAELRRLQGR